MEVYKPPYNIRKLNLENNSIFLAGSIEMGKASNWQKEIEDSLSDVNGIILNPRRENWNSSWSQSIENRNFRQQVEWELYGLEHATMIALYFEPDTKSPISLLELGIHVNSKKIIVCCPEGYMKKGNVDITCKQYHAPLFDDFEKFKTHIKTIATNNYNEKFF